MILEIVVGTVMEAFYPIPSLVRPLKIEIFVCLKVNFLTGTNLYLLYVIVGDEAFSLRTNIMRPYPGWNLNEPEAIFNYRLSRAHRIIENSFGILTSRWHLFRCPIITDPHKVVLLTKASIALHNFLQTTESSMYCPPGFIDGEDSAGNVIKGSWRAEHDSTGLQPLGSVGGNRLSTCTYSYSLIGSTVFYFFISIQQMLLP